MLKQEYKSPVERLARLFKKSRDLWKEKVAKCLVILGITQSDWQKIAKQARGLQHQDVEVLAINVLTHSNGQVIEQSLESLALRVGQPVQILADQTTAVTSKKGATCIASHIQKCSIPMMLPIGWPCFLNTS